MTNFVQGDTFAVRNIAEQGLITNPEPMQTTALGSIPASDTRNMLNVTELH
jgi:hypothetical protein